MWRDLRNAVRALAHARSFTLTATLALALAVGANGAIFGLVDALWLRPPGVRSPGTLVRVFATTPSEREGAWSWPEFLDVKGRATALNDVAVRGRRGAVMTTPDGSQELLLVNVVSTNFFEMLGVTPAAGRLFGAADDGSLQQAPAVVLGHAFWRTFFGGDPGVIGRTVTLGRGEALAVTVIGVLPGTFRDLEAAADRDLWMPPQTWTRIGGSMTEFQARDSRWFEMIARRNDGRTVEAANRQLAAIAGTLARDFPAISAGRGARVVDDLGYRMERGGVAATAMLALVLLVVLITCVNVANLPRVKFNAVSPNYFDVMGSRLVRGRAFSTDDDRGGAAAVISQQFARQFFPGRDPLGATIQVGGRSHRVVGIAQDSVVNEIGEPPQPYLYLPFGQGAYGETTFILETAGDADAIAAAARATLRQVDARLEPRRMVTMAQYIAYATSMHRTTAALATILGLVGLVLTAVGVYGVVACRTNRRTKEIGIRMALGAASAEVIGLVMRDGLRLGALGIVVGLPLALGSTWLVASMLVGVRPWDVVSFAAAAAILLAAIAIATFLPARRAMRIQPAQALR